MLIDLESAAQIHGIDAVSMPSPFGAIIPRRYRSSETDCRGCVRKGAAVLRSGNDWAPE